MYVLLNRGNEGQKIMSVAQRSNLSLLRSVTQFSPQHEHKAQEQRRCARQRYSLSRLNRSSATSETSSNHSGFSARLKNSTTIDGIS